MFDDSLLEVFNDFIIVNEESFGKKWRGSEKCKFYIVELKKKIFDFLDFLMLLKNKYKIVLREKGVYWILV